MIKPKTTAEWEAHYQQIMAARDQQELIYLDQLRAAWAALRKYGSHCKNCAIFDNFLARCDCGWVEVVKG